MEDLAEHLQCRHVFRIDPSGRSIFKYLRLVHVLYLYNQRIDQQGLNKLAT